MSKFHVVNNQRIASSLLQFEDKRSHHDPVLRRQILNSSISTNKGGILFRQFLANPEAYEVHWSNGENASLLKSIMAYNDLALKATSDTEEANLINSRPQPVFTDKAVGQMFSPGAGTVGIDPILTEKKAEVNNMKVATAADSTPSSGTGSQLETLKAQFAQSRINSPEQINNIIMTALKTMAPEQAAKYIMDKVVNPNAEKAQYFLTSISQITNGVE